ncbi:MAG TPA: hypothetical protein VM715_20760 [Candidatus Acidoferrum sp.]|nr:hypothetical protein [Candidatus Acidoferrum sp.]
MDCLHKLPPTARRIASILPSPGTADKTIVNKLSVAAGLVTIAQVLAGHDQITRRHCKGSCRRGTKVGGGRSECAAGLSKVSSVCFGAKSAASRTQNQKCWIIAL